MHFGPPQENLSKDAYSASIFGANLANANGAISIGANTAVGVVQKFWRY